jgi:hypothetical protein
MRAYRRALDTREQVLARVAAGILQYLIQETLQGFADVRTRSNSSFDELVASDREILQLQRLLTPDDGSDCGL